MFALLPLLKTWIVMLTKYWFYGYDELFVLFAQDKKKSDNRGRNLPEVVGALGINYYSQDFCRRATGYL